MILKDFKKILNSLLVWKIFKDITKVFNLKSNIIFDLKYLIKPLLYTLILKQIFDYTSCINVTIQDETIRYETFFLILPTIFKLAGI